ncbi:hypothetical protein [Amycolatopsis sp.]|uniref:hypothetical protein n=1 Tax=Amycolatopsis sp. TaxID=37632 RepID=UPI00261492DE|nr:hypothetical protein [Amycolatopsis sp.]
MAVRDEGERVVVTLTDELQAALASADEARLRDVAPPWSQTDEFPSSADPDHATSVLGELAGLARTATERGERLYCWICV